MTPATSQPVKVFLVGVLAFSLLFKAKGAAIIPSTGGAARARGSAVNIRGDNRLAVASDVDRDLNDNACAAHDAIP